MGSAVEVEAIYQRRFGPDLVFRQGMWRVLCSRFFQRYQRYVPRDSTVLEIGAGYCEFINSIAASRKIAVDLNPDTHLYASPDVRTIETSSTDLAAIPSGSVDLAFASNFFEHLTRGDIILTMREVARVLKPTGRFLILQPNISAFQVTRTIVRFLSFTIKVRLPRLLFIVRLYPHMPIILRILGQQTFVVAALDRGRRQS
jgi:SAM-dependent methyltransferase